MLSKHTYSAFANSCPLQTDTFLFQLFIATMSNSLQAGFNSVMIDLPHKNHAWGTPRRVIFKVKLEIINTRNFSLRGSFTNICRIYAVSCLV